MNAITIPPRVGTFFDKSLGRRLEAASQLDEAWSDYVIIMARMRAVWERTYQSAREVEAATGMRPDKIFDLRRSVSMHQAMVWARHFRALTSPMLIPSTNLSTAFVAAPHGRASSTRIVAWRIATAVEQRRYLLDMSHPDLATLVGVDRAFIARLLRAPGRGHGPMPMSLLELLCVCRPLSLSLADVVARSVRNAHPDRDEPMPGPGITRKA